MKRTITILSILIGMGFIYLLQGCTAASDSKKAIIISGQVLDKNTGNIIDEAIIQITSPSSLRSNTQSDSAGNFTFDLEVDSTATLNIKFDKTGYNSASKTITVARGVDITDLIIELTPESSGSNNDSGGGEQVGGEPEGAAAIVLSGVSNQAINIKETGDVVSSAFTFEVQDSAGRPLNSAKAVEVSFSIVAGPGGGETIIPDKAKTNAQGKVTTSLFSGNAAGPVKVQALINRADVGLTIKSKPVLIAIHGGFPDANHFSIAPNTFNFEGYNINGIRDAITVIVGDKFSNPVKPGTVVYFKSSGGVIQGSGETNEDGIVTVDLISGDPRPNDTVTGSGGRPGYATVTASTIDENDTRISKQATILFSGIPTAPVISPTTFDIPPNGGASFTYTVTDQNGNPLPPGTEFKVEVGEGLDASGDADFKLGDYLFPGAGTTDFSFSVMDTDELASDRGGTTITVRVTTPDGKQASTSISGFRAKVRSN